MTGACFGSGAYGTDGQAGWSLTRPPAAAERVGGEGTHPTPAACTRKVQWATRADGVAWPAVNGGSSLTAIPHAPPLPRLATRRRMR